jgi:hypothetical protein
MRFARAEAINLDTASHPVCLLLIVRHLLTTGRDSGAHFLLLSAVSRWRGGCFVLVRWCSPEEVKEIEE